MNDSVFVKTKNTGRIEVTVTLYIKIEKYSFKCIITYPQLIQRLESIIFYLLSIEENFIWKSLLNSVNIFSLFVGNHKISHMTKNGCLFRYLLCPRRESTHTLYQIKQCRIHVSADKHMRNTWICLFSPL